jgi:hypothetical protein
MALSHVLPAVHVTDTHTDLHRLLQLREELASRRERFDLVIHSGDIADMDSVDLESAERLLVLESDTATTLAVVESIAAPIIYIPGNVRKCSDAGKDAHHQTRPTARHSQSVPRRRRGGQGRRGQCAAVWESHAQYPRQDYPHCAKSSCGWIRRGCPGLPRGQSEVARCAAKLGLSVRVIGRLTRAPVVNRIPIH